MIQLRALQNMRLWQAPEFCDNSPVPNQNTAGKCLLVGLHDGGHLMFTIRPLKELTADPSNKTNSLMKCPEYFTYVKADEEVQELVSDSPCPSLNAHLVSFCIEHGYQ